MSMCIDGALHLKGRMLSIHVEPDAFHVVV
jgi:hypothetical protein